jgi:uncharacterized Fe-S radical SAM superfamily protein PflX
MALLALGILPNAIFCCAPGRQTFTKKEKVENKEMSVISNIEPNNGVRNLNRVSSNANPAAFLPFLLKQC